MTVDFTKTVMTTPNGAQTWSHEVELEIKDINFLVGFSKDPLQFKSLIRRFLQNAAALTNLMTASIEEIVVLKDKNQRALAE